MNKSKLLFLNIMIMGTLITMSSNNWISMWMGLEMNMISFIPFMSLSKSKNSAEANMTYFLVQSMSSMMLMFSIIMLNISKMQLFEYTLIMSLLIKLGGAPFHMWVPEIMSKMSWNNCFIFMTWQKIAPLSILSNMYYNNMIMFLSIIMSVMFGALGGLNQTSLRKIMGYSSINHMGWILSLSKNQNNWCMYMLIYSIIISMMCYMFNYNNMLFINQMNHANMSLSEKIIHSISFLSLGGLPPFLGFLPKWLTIQSLIMDNSYIMLFIMIMFSLITLFYYLHITIYLMINSSIINKWITYKSNKLLTVSIMMINMSLPLIMIMNFI